MFFEFVSCRRVLRVRGFVLRRQGPDTAGQQFGGSYADPDVRTSCRTRKRTASSDLLLYSRDKAPENTTFVLNTTHDDLLTTNVSRIQVDDKSADVQSWPIGLFGHNPGHDLLKVDVANSSSIK